MRFFEHVARRSLRCVRCRGPIMCHGKDEIPWMICKLHISVRPEEKSPLAGCNWRDDMQYKVLGARLGIRRSWL
jgi:hypothetical protein